MSAPSVFWLVTGLCSHPFGLIDSAIHHFRAFAAENLSASG